MAPWRMARTPARKSISRHTHPSIISLYIHSFLLIASRQAVADCLEPAWNGDDMGYLLSHTQCVDYSLTTTADLPPANLDELCKEQQSTPHDPTNPRGSVAIPRRAHHRRPSPLLPSIIQNKWRHTDHMASSSMLHACPRCSVPVNRPTTLATRWHATMEGLQAMQR